MDGYFFTLTDLKWYSIGLTAFNFSVSKTESETTDTILLVKATHQIPSENKGFNDMFEQNNMSWLLDPFSRARW